MATEMENSGYSDERKWDRVFQSLNEIKADMKEFEEKTRVDIISVRQLVTNRPASVSSSTLKY